MEKQTNTLNLGSTKVLCGIIKGTRFNWLLHYNAMENLKLKWCSLRATEEERLPLKSQKSLPASAYLESVSPRARPPVKIQHAVQFWISETQYFSSISLSQTTFNYLKFKFNWILYMGFCCYCWIWRLYPRQYEVGILQVSSQYWCPYAPPASISILLLLLRWPWSCIQCDSCIQAAYFR